VRWLYFNYFKEVFMKHTVKTILFIGLALIALFGTTACPNSAGGSGGGTTPPTGTTYTVGGVNFTMKDIAAVTNGTVGYSGESDNEPHTVSLSAYLIGETEVTQELWQAVMGTNPSFFDNTGNKMLGSDTYDTNITSGEVQEKRPVENVNWYQCIAFCNKLSKLCNLDPCYTVSGVNFDALNFSDIPTSDDSDWNNAVCDRTKNGFRLPTEAEWEWAAMGGTNDKWAGTNEKAQLVNYAWYKNDDGGDANGKTHQVKLKSANGYGLYDMSGNVREWCWDRYGSLSGTLSLDYAGAASGDSRVLRGGDWYNDADYAARACRNYDDPDLRVSNLGLRLVSRP